MLQVDDINFGAPQFEQEHRMCLASGYIRKVIVGALRWRRNFALLGVEVFSRGLLVLGSSRGIFFRCYSFSHL